ncbi:hypothetical protein [Hymenobacter negativus]|uniref:Uncharacterized protein n=1 Tax=Hymenobacter negativus TaxID=2795026 RepID=A0ABS3QIQ5_9BACT|nr:hypothetical protein [Hymenobacter negativus]MBO2010883.1 hypothetical protein [Hymenobacter negativus]
MPLIDDTPKLTLYRDGYASLNGEAYRSLGTAVAIMLLPPTTPGTRWQLLPRKTSAGALLLSVRTDRGASRFRAPALAAALFAALPPTFDGPLYLELVLSPETGFELVAQSCVTTAAA